MRPVAELLRQAGLDLKKSLGQNFLVNPRALERIARHLEPDPRSLILEIGCGVGNLTALLAQQARAVIAVELDERFRPIHAAEFRSAPHVRFVYGDFLETDLPALMADPALPPAPADGWTLKVAGNIPYHLTSPILFKLLASPLAFERIGLLMQREVGARLAARPGSREHGILAVKIATLYDVEKLMEVPPGSFLPPPRVHSCFMRLKPRAGGPLVADPAERAAFFAFVDTAFAQRRKMLVNSLAAATGGVIEREAAEAALRDAGHDVRSRAEALGAPALLDIFRRLGSPRLPRLRRSFDSPAED